MVGGVFLRLFVSNPGWVLRRPKEFFIEVMDRLLEMAVSHSCDVILFLTLFYALISYFYVF